VQRRLGLLKHGVIVLAVGSFVALAGLAADKASATTSDTSAKSRTQTSRQQSFRSTDPYFGDGSDYGSGGTLGGSDSPPVAGSSAS
jgi:hypothetical protein